MLLKHMGIKYVIDIGANTGQFAESLFDFDYQGTVISFEPVASCHEKLTRRSRKYPNFRVAERCAIGDKDTQIEFNVSDDDVFSSVLEIKKEHTRIRPKSRIVRKESVKMFRLDSIIGNYIPEGETDIMLKIDTQGFEKQVLDGAEHSLSRIRGIKIEIPLVPIYDGTRFTFYEIVDFMKQHGFMPYNFNTEGVDLETGRVFTIDGTFFRESLQ